MLKLILNDLTIVAAYALNSEGKTASWDCINNGMPIKPCGGSCDELQPCCELNETILDLDDKVLERALYQALRNHFNHCEVIENALAERGQYAL